MNQLNRFNPVAAVCIFLVIQPSLVLAKGYEHDDRDPSAPTAAKISNTADISADKTSESESDPDPKSKFKSEETDETSADLAGDATTEAQSDDSSVDPAEVQLDRATLEYAVANHGRVLIGHGKTFVLIPNSDPRITNTVEEDRNQRLTQKVLWRGSVALAVVLTAWGLNKLRLRAVHYHRGADARTSDLNEKELRYNSKQSVLGETNRKLEQSGRNPITQSDLDYTLGSLTAHQRSLAGGSERAAREAETTLRRDGRIGEANAIQRDLIEFGRRGAEYEALVTRSQNIQRLNDALVAHQNEVDTARTELTQAQADQALDHHPLNRLARRAGRFGDTYGNKIQKGLNYLKIIAAAGGITGILHAFLETESQLSEKIVDATYASRNKKVPIITIDARYLSTALSELERRGFNEVDLDSIEIDK